MVRDLGNKQRSQLTKEDDTKEKEKKRKYKQTVDRHTGTK